MMQRVLQKSGPSPYALSVMAGVLLIAVTAYPKPLDESAFCTEKIKANDAQCVTQPTQKMDAQRK